MRRRRIRIVEVIATLDAGGAERQMALLASGLDRARFDPLVVALTRGGPVEAPLRAAGVPVEVLGKQAKLSPGALLALAARLERARPDIVHTHLFTANAYGRAAGLLARVPVLVATEQALDPYKRAHHRAIDRLLARRSAAVVCASEAILARLAERGVPREKLVRIYNGVRVPPAPRAAFEPDLVVTASRLDPVKDIPTLVRAVARIGARLDIIGEGEARPAIAAEIARAGPAAAARIRLLGYLADPLPAIARGAVFALASRTEGFGVAIAEAMALGLPVVASRVDGIVEVVEDGRTGLLVPPGDAAAFAAAIAALLGDPDRARAMGEAGRGRVQDRFSAERMVREYESLFERCAGSPA